MGLEKPSDSLKETAENIIERTSDLREVTYKYIDLSIDEYSNFSDGQYFNETIFLDYLCPGEQRDLINELKREGTDQIIFEKLKILTENKLNKDIGILTEYLDDCPEDEKPLIEMQVTALEFTKNALDFELELAGYEHGLSDKKIQEKIALQENLDEKLFGEHVSQNPDFILESYVYTKYLLENNGDKLSAEQRNRLEHSQNDMLKQISKLQGKSIEEIEIPSYIPPDKDKDFEKLSHIMIDRDDYIKIFDTFFEMAGVPQRCKKGNYTAFYDGDDHYGVPDNSSYAQKSLEEILRLAAHETSHYVNLRSTKERKEQRQVGDIFKEEGLSMLTEMLVSGVNIENMSYMTFAGPSVVMNRLYDGSDYEEYQDAYLELLEKNDVSSKGDVKGKSLRKVRGFHKYLPGGTNKDAAYALGLQGVLKYIRSENPEFENLMGGKISLEQMESGNFKPLNFGNKHIQHILLAEFLFFYLKRNDGSLSEDSEGKDTLHNDFLTHVKEKYKNFGSAFGLFNEADKFTFENKRKVAEILGIINKSKKKSIEVDREYMVGGFTD